MPEPPRSSTAMWSESLPLRDLMALERRWLATQRESIATGGRVWLAPAVVESPDDALSLALESNGLVRGALTGDAEHLPLGDGSLRCLVVQHALDQPVPHAFFGECVRVLSTQGELVIFGVNPWSAWRPWLSHHSGRAGANTRTRMVGRLRALFVQLGLQFHELRWLGPRYPGPVDGEVPEANRFTDALRASYALVLRKPHDTVIPLRTREASPARVLSPSLVPTPRVATRAIRTAHRA